jgi:hypothetical protein
MMNAEVGMKNWKKKPEEAAERELSPTIPMQK